MIDVPEQAHELVHRIAVDKQPPNTRRSARLAIGEAPDGATRWLPVWVIKGQHPGPRVTVTAGVHGDEFEGPRAVMRLAQTIATDEVNGVLVIAPIVNPSAFHDGSRSSPVDGLNLNRVFPGDEAGAPSERLAARLMATLVQDSDLLIDLHSGGTKLLHAPIMGYYDLPGDAGSRSFAAATRANFPYVWNLPHRRGVLSYEAVREGIPAIGGELGGAGRCLPGDVRHYQSSVLSVLQSMSVLPAGSEPSLRPQIVSGDWLVSERAGFFEPVVELEQRVEAGQPLGHVLDAFGVILWQLVAPLPGIVLGLRTFPTVWAGDLLVFVPEVGQTTIKPVSST